MKHLIIAVQLTMFTAAYSQNVQLPAAPSESELRHQLSLAASGNADPFETVNAIGRVGDGCVQALTNIALGPHSPNTDSTVWANEDRVSFYAASCLETIATQAAYAGLLKVGMSAISTDVRAVALHAIAGRFHHDVMENKIPPDKNVIHLFLSTVDDTAMSQYSGRTLAGIAREGLKTWANWDLGSPDHGPTTMKKGDQDVSLAQLRDLLWQEVADRITWNKDAGHFDLPRK